MKKLQGKLNNYSETLNILKTKLLPLVQLRQKKVRNTYLEKQV